MTTRIVLLMLGVLLGLGAGCAQKDWIEQTLVTVDVTGTWQRTEGALLTLHLKQQGPKLNGSVTRFGVGGTTISGTIEGTVAGDVFSFNQTSGLGVLRGEMEVNEDEMKGWVNFGGPQAVVALKRTSSSPQSTSQP